MTTNENFLEKMPKQDQEFINKYYDIEFNPIKQPKNRQIQSKRNYLIKKLIKIQNRNELKPKGKTLCERLNTDYNTTTKLIELLDEDDKKVILEAYDQECDYSKKRIQNQEVTTYITQSIIPKLKRYLTNGIKKKK